MLTRNRLAKLSTIAEGTDAVAIWTIIADALGEDAADVEAVTAGFEAVKRALTAQQTAASKLSARELAMCREKKIEPSKYLAKRTAIKARSAR